MNCSLAMVLHLRSVGNCERLSAENTSRILWQHRRWGIDMNVADDSCRKPSRSRLTRPINDNLLTTILINRIWWIIIVMPPPSQTSRRGIMVSSCPSVRSSVTKLRPWTTLCKFAPKVVHGTSEWKINVGIRSKFKVTAEIGDSFLKNYLWNFA